jgi:hypothetical protein
MCRGILVRFSEAIVKPLTLWGLERFLCHL